MNLTESQLSPPRMKAGKNTCGNGKFAQNVNGLYAVY
jgi:hypothetical protein